jgi:hypothetical protein
MPRRKPAASGPNNGYLVSFGDTMTALLAFFIVLNSLASDQSGADLHSGTGSFVHVTNSMGLPGLFSTEHSSYPFSMIAPSPLFENVSDAEGASGAGPDDSADSIWERDRAWGEFQRLLFEFERYHETNHQRTVVAEVSIDRLGSWPPGEGLLDKDLRQQLSTLLPLIRSGFYEIEYVIWATTPSASAWSRGLQQAAALQTSIRSQCGLAPAECDRVRVIVRNWNARKIKRPALSCVVRRLSVQ